MVPGKDMEDNFGEAEVGETDSIQGTVDHIIYNLWEMKDPNYVMRIMTTGGCLLEDDTWKENVRVRKENGEDVVKKIKYKIPFDWNFHYRHAVNDHNNLSHALQSI